MACLSSIDKVGHHQNFYLELFVYWDGNTANYGLFTVCYVIMNAFLINLAWILSSDVIKISELISNLKA